MLSTVTVGSDGLTLLWEQQEPDQPDQLDTSFPYYIYAMPDIMVQVPEQDMETSYAYTLSGLVPGRLYDISLHFNPITSYPDPLETVQVLSGKFKPTDYRF